MVSVLVSSLLIIGILTNIINPPNQFLFRDDTPESETSAVENYKNNFLKTENIPGDSPEPARSDREQDIKDFLETEIMPIDLVWDMLEQVNQDRALNDLRYLTGEEPICLDAACYTIKDRHTGSEGLDWAQDYLYENLVEQGYTVEIYDWSSSGHTDENLIAWKQGVIKPTEEVYIVSHLDGISSSETYFPSADDNASSVVNGLELSRILSKYEFERTLVLFFSTGEEQGTLGVKAYLDQLTSEELEKIKFVVNRDMTGYDGNDDGVMELFHGDHPPSITLTQMIGEIIAAYQLDLVPKIVSGCP